MSHQHDEVNEKDFETLIQELKFKDSDEKTVLIQ